MLRYKREGAIGWRNALVNGLNHIILGLAPNTAYEVQVRAVYGQAGNVSAYSPSGIGRTAVGMSGVLPDKPAPPIVSPGGPRELIVKWQPPASHGHPVAGYSLRYGNTTSWTEIAGLTSPTWTLTVLEYSEWYNVQVAAINAVGQGEWSATGRGVTAPAPALPPGGGTERLPPDAGFQLPKNLIAVLALLAASSIVARYTRNAVWTGLTALAVLLAAVILKAFSPLLVLLVITIGAGCLAFTFMAKK